MRFTGYRFLGLVGLFLVHGLFAQSEVSWVGALPEAVQESSGLLLVGDRFVTHNDSGNTPELFVLDTTSLEVVRRVRVTNAQNVDWEDLAQDATYIYIGDIGNNLGARKDLKVLRISREAFFSSSTVEAEAISYVYEDQSGFDGNQNSDWDAEALLAGPDSLYIFTKQWQGGHTVAYRIPKEPGQYQALRMREYPVDGLVTGASPIPGKEGFLLLAYSGQLQPFLLRVSTEVSDASDSNQTRKIQLDIPFGQTEGITVLATGVVYLSTESFSNRLLSLPAGIFRYVPGEQPGEDAGGAGPGQPQDGEEGSQELVLYQTPGTHKLQYLITNNSTITAKAIFDVSGRRIQFMQGQEALPGEIDVSGLGSGIYYFTVFLPDQPVSKPFLRY